MRILVTFAVDAEFAPWRKRHPFESLSIEMPQRYFQESYYETRIGNLDIVACLTGIGCTFTEQGLRTLFAKKPDVCISSGLAGGLRADLEKGDIAAAKFVRLVDGPERMGANTGLFESAVEHGAKGVDTCLTARHIVGQSQFKRAMSGFGDMVEMESFRIMNMCSGPQVASLTVRAISDTVDEDLPLDFSQVLDTNGRIVKRQLALQLARYPNKIRALIRFGKESQNAAVKLADFLDGFLPAIGEKFTHGIPGKREQVVP